MNSHDGSTTAPGEIESHDFVGGIEFSQYIDFNMEDYIWNDDDGPGGPPNSSTLDSLELPETAHNPLDPGIGQNFHQDWITPFDPLDTLHFPRQICIKKEALQTQSTDLGMFDSVSAQSLPDYSDVDLSHKCASTSAVHRPDLSEGPSLPAYIDLADYSDLFSGTSLSQCDSWQGNSQLGSRSGSVFGNSLGSRCNSLGSFSSDRPRSRHRPSSQTSIHRTESSTRFQELVFDTNLSRTSSITSASSKRHKPLDSIARAAMKAVKAIGACWRCRFLRKQVSGLLDIGFKL